MMNVRALFVLLSSLGAVMFLSPEPSIRRINNEIVLVEAVEYHRQGKGPVESAKKAAEDVVSTASDYAKQTGEGIRQMGYAAYDKLSASQKLAEEEAAEFRARLAHEEASKHHLHRANEDSANAASEYAAASKERLQQAYQDSAKAASDYRQRLNQAYEESANAASDYGAASKQRLSQAYEDSANAASEYAAASKQRLNEAYEDSRNAASDYTAASKQRVHQAYEESAEYAARMKERLSDYSSSGAASARDSLGDTAHSAGDAGHHLGESIKHVGKDHSPEHESVLSKLGKAKVYVKERAQEAAYHQTNLGHGVGYYQDEHYHASSFKDDEARKMEEYLEGAKASAKDAMEKAAEGLGLLRNQLKELEPHEEHPSIETARSKIGEYYDTTKDVVLGALSRKEQQVGRSLDSAKKHVESYYDRAKESSLASLEHQKEKLGQYLDMVRMKLNGGREAVFHYAVSTIQNSKEAVIDEKNKLYRRAQEMEDEASRWGNNAKNKVNQTLKQAGRWAHEKMTKSEELAIRMFHKSVSTVVRLLHLFVFSSVFGSALWVTFISGFVLSRTIPRQQFAVTQSKIFPVYFRMMGSGITVLIATHLLLHPPPSADFPEHLQYFNLGVCLLLTLLNAFVLEPRLTKTMFEKLRLEKEEGRGVDAAEAPVIDEQARLQLTGISKRLQALHTYSSVANLAMLAGMTWHLWYLNCRLVI